MFAQRASEERSIPSSLHGALISQPVRLRSVDADLARLRTLVGAGRHAQVDVGGEPVNLQVTRCMPAGPGDMGRLICFQTAGGPIHLAASRDVVRVITSVDLPEGDEGDADPFQRLLLEEVVNAWPTGWCELFGGPLIVVGDMRDPGPFELTLLLAPAGAPWGMATRLRGTCDALAGLLSQPGWQRASSPHSMVPADWRLTVPVSAGCSAIPMKVFRKLAVADILMVTQPDLGVDGVGMVKFGHRIAKCRLHFGNQAGLEFTEWLTTTTGPTMTFPDSTSFDAPPEPGADEAFDGVPVTLSFQVGMVEMSLSELKALAAGMVVQVHGSLPPQVSISAGGQRIGMGELVEVDGRLGVEIRRLGEAA